MELSLTKDTHIKCKMQTYILQTQFNRVNCSQFRQAVISQFHFCFNCTFQWNKMDTQNLTSHTKMIQVVIEPDTFVITFIHATNVAQFVYFLFFFITNSSSKVPIEWKFNFVNSNSTGTLWCPIIGSNLLITCLINSLTGIYSMITESASSKLLCVYFHWIFIRTTFQFLHHLSHSSPIVRFNWAEVNNQSSMDSEMKKKYSELKLVKGKK